MSDYFPLLPDDWRIGEDSLEQAYKAVTQAAEAWRKKWPCACKNCGGWGGWSSIGNYYTPPDAEPCEAMGPEFCHRCGYEGFDEDHEGLGKPERHKSLHGHGCFWCGHADDDGEPSW
jgi:hypothetical protein